MVAKSFKTRVALTNPAKVLYPAAGTTKSDVFDYYTGIAELMLPHIAGRPVTRKRWPNGVDQGAFFEKQLAVSAPSWLARGAIEHRHATTTYPIIDDIDGLAWIAQQAALEVHVPQWRFSEQQVSAEPQPDLIRKPGPATRLIFDLDPGDDVTMSQLAEVARAIRELASDMGLPAFPVTSGSKGIHIYAALDRPVSSADAVTVAKRVAQQLQYTMPTLVTANMAKQQRAGKVFLDWSQNNASKTTIAPYSLRGRDYPTVAAPRTWAELDDSDLHQLRYDEVLKRAARDGDLLAGLDRGLDRLPRRQDRLVAYRSKRDATRTPEPVPTAPPTTGANDRFVIQEHHSRTTHYDFRLERDGVLVSWAVPKNLPDAPGVNRLAVRTEDHPREYSAFEGTIPAGQYGAGTVRVWDSGTYVTEKFLDTTEKGEVTVVLSGHRISGRYALNRTDGDHWLVCRMKDQKLFSFADLNPMLATEGPVSGLDPNQWAFEGKWDGYRLLVDADHAQVRMRSRTGRDVTGDYPQLTFPADDLADHHIVLDGELVALDESGAISFAQMQHRTRAVRLQFWAFDLLYLDGNALFRVAYRDRRKLLETLSRGTRLIVHDLLTGTGVDALEQSRRLGWEGVVAKKWDSTYRPGRRTSVWVKQKHWRTEDVVIGGWRVGQGTEIGSLLLGIPGADGLRFVGRVGTGFTEIQRKALKEALAALRTDTSPFRPALSSADAKGVTFVEPTLVAEVRFGERTADGRLRHPSWRGLRPDKSVDELTVQDFRD